MPAPAKTSDEKIVTAARELVARLGAEALSMQAVADRVGLRAPSLYKRFPDRAALLEAVERRVLADLERTIRRAARPGKIAPVARAYRQFAKRHRRLYELLFSGATRDSPDAVAARGRAAQPAVDLMAQLVGESRALAATRVLTAFLHGFVSMENAGEFRLGPGVDQSFSLGLRIFADTIRLNFGSKTSRL